MRGFFHYGMRHPKAVIAGTVLAVVIALAQFPRFKVDTDPENMLPSDAPGGFEYLLQSRQPENDQGLRHLKRSAF